MQMLELKRRETEKSFQWREKKSVNILPESLICYLCFSVDGLSFLKYPTCTLLLFRQNAMSQSSPAKLNSLSIFFPCYNEALNIPLFMEEAIQLLPQLAKKFEIIVVNDGSQDNTQKVAEKFASKYPFVRVVTHQENKGYGASLRSGFAAAQYEWVFFTDGDLQFNLEQLAEFLPFTNQHSVIIGYRKNRADGFSRHRNALLLKFYVDVLFRVHVKDIDCAFKLIKKEALDKIHLESSGAFISSELLYKLKKKRYRFKQLPVDHYPRKFGKPTGANFKVILRAIKESIQLYLHMKLGWFNNRKY